MMVARKRLLEPDEMVAMKDAGASLADIATRAKVSPLTVRALISKWRIAQTERPDWSPPWSAAWRTSERAGTEGVVATDDPARMRRRR